MRDWRYAPDLPVDTPNTWRIVDGFHPDIYGNYRTGWLPAAAISTATGAGNRFYAGLAYQVAAGSQGVVLVWPGTGAGGKAYVWDGAVWTDRKGATTVASASCFLQFGNTTLAGGISIGLFQRDASGIANFAAVGAGSPLNIGGLAVSSLNIVLAIDTTSDAWATSDTNTAVVWNSGETASGNLRTLPGPNTACVPLGNDFIVFKNRGIFRGQYIGGTLKWVWTVIDRHKGAWGTGCAVAAGDGKVYFIGDTGFWSYDGASFERCDYGIWQTLLQTLGANVTSSYQASETQLVFDSVNQLIFLFQQTTVSGATGGRALSANIFYTYNIQSKRWGKQGRLSETSSGDDLPMVLNIRALNTLATSWASDGSGARLFNSDVGFYSITNDKVEVLTTLFTPAALPGTNYKPSLRTSRFGQLARKTLVTRFTPGWTLSDGRGTDLSTATVKEAATFYGESNIQGNSSGATVNLSGDGVWADYIKTARFHNVELHVNCDAVIDGGDWESKDAGAA